MLSTGKWHGRWLAGAAIVALAAPGVADAATQKEKELEARIARLEAAFGAMQGELTATRAENAELREAASRAEAKAVQVATAVEAAKAAPPPAQPEGFRSGNTTIKIGGFLKTVATFSRWDDGDVAANALGRDFYLPHQIPIGGTRESTDSDVNAKHTRLWLNLQSDVAGHTLKGYVETDFQTTASTAISVAGGGSERTTNGYTLALRRAFVQLDKFTIGQDWSTFQYVAALPESTDFVGTTEGTVFVRQPLVRYSTPLSKETTLHLAVENGETASAGAAGPALTENDDERMPDFVVRLNHAAKFGELSLAGLVRQLSVDNGVVGDRAMAWGASAAGKIWLNGDKTADLRLMATYGQGIGRYVGLNFVPDAIVTPGTGELRRVENFAAMAALRLPLAKNVRTNLMGSWQHASYPGGFAAGQFNAYNDTAWSVAGNIFWSPVKNVDVGVEYRHGMRELVSGASGQLDRIEFAAKYGF